MFYVTGDIHGDFLKLKRSCEKVNTTKDDVLILLGDSGFNYYEDHRDNALKILASELPVTIFCIHGNHEQRASKIAAYDRMEFCGGNVLVEEKYPNLLFALDGEIYDFDGNKTIVIGGAYSVDKYYRIRRQMKWWSNEQPSDRIKAKVEQALTDSGWNIDIVLSHTGPRKFEPVEFFLPMVDQSTVDKTTEEWLDKIEDKLSYDKWYFGHYHCDKKIDKVRIMHYDVSLL